MRETDLKPISEPMNIDWALCQPPGNTCQQATGGNDQPGSE
jgi:hypothetical protein